MSIETQATLVLVAATSLYVWLGLRLWRRGRPAAAGAAMAVCACAPLAWQVVFTRSTAPGFALFLVLMALPAIALTGVGLVRARRRPGAGRR